MNKKKIAVIAGNHREYMNFISDAINKNQFIEADRPDKLRGTELCAFIEIGTCYDRKDYYLIRREAAERIR